MGKVNGMWQDALEDVLDKYRQHEIDREGAVVELSRLGFSSFDAQEQLSAAEEDLVSDR